MADTSPALGAIDALSPAQVATLAAIGFFDADQLLGAAAVEGMNAQFATVLGVSRGEADALIEAVRQAAGGVQLEPPTDDDLPSLGALEPTDEIKAEIERLTTRPTATGALPPSVNHIALMNAVRDQGQRGTCVAFAETAVHELHRRSLGRIEDLSEEFLYFETKKIDGIPQQCGTFQVKAVRVFETLGQCSEAVWPYEMNPPCNHNGPEPANARADAATRKCQPVILGPKDVLAAKTLLAAGNAVGFSIPVYNSWYRNPTVMRTGRLTMRVGNEPVVGGHAMCFVGYKDDATQPGGGYFILRNSWNTAWASACSYGAGYGTIPYAYIRIDGWELVSVR
jgi:C1A family cysteine protease